LLLKKIKEDLSELPWKANQSTRGLTLRRADHSTKRSAPKVRPRVKIVAVSTVGQTAGMEVAVSTAGQTAVMKGPGFAFKKN